MMNIVDEDIELLESSLDGGLSESEAVDLRGRLARDPGLAIALDDLRVQRAVRQSLWSSLEPTDGEVDRFAARVRAAAGRRRTPVLARTLRIAGAIAACIAISFVAGWKFHTRQLAATGPHMSSTKPRAALTYDVSLTDEHGRVTAVQNFDSLEKAREFAKDLSQWQQRQQQMRDGAAVIVADQF